MEFLEKVLNLEKKNEKFEGEFERYEVVEVKLQ
jgi:hypothetical protein